MRLAILLSAVSLTAFAYPAAAQTSADSGSDQASITVIAHAQTLAPSSMPLDVTQPTSVIQSEFIANNIVPLASVDDIIKFQPSVWSQNPNGPGIGKAETMEIRGFQDGQYNVTFDGIPFGDSQDLHHTTSSLFIAHALQEAEIDRGPGTASTIGKATFGGTVGFLSKDPLNHFDLDAYGTVGSFNTFSGGGRVDTGEIGSFRLFGEGQHEQTDGYLTGSAEKRDNFIGKAILDVSPVTKLTALASWNRERQATTQGATLPEYAQFGNNYGLCNNPKAMCYSGYQPSTYYTDFEYLRLQSNFQGVDIDEMVYHNGFIHSYIESSDASDDNPADDGVTFYSPTTIGKKLTTDATDIKGKLTNARVSTWGNTLRFEKPGKAIDLKWGLWADFQHDDRYSDTIDLSQNDIPVTGKTGTAYSYNYTDMGITLQPYVEAVVRPVAGLTLTPGFKYTSYSRRLDAILNKTGPNGETNKTYNATQPSVVANYQITSHWTAYVQAARGFLAPPIATFQVQDPTSLKPETTWNYQAGTVIHGRNWSASFDGYYIDFDNFLSAQQTLVNGSEESTYVNAGGAIYKGLEFEGQYVLFKGLSLYGNATLNSAKYKGTGADLEESPKFTAAAGVLYDDKHGPFFSLIGKAIGPRYGNDMGNVPLAVPTYVNGNVLLPAGTIDDPTSHIGTTFTADLAAGWHIDRVAGPLHGITVSMKIGNLFNSHAVTDYAGTQSTTTGTLGVTPGNAPLNLYWRTPGRSFFFNLEGHL